MSNVTRVDRVKHTTHKPIERSGFVHYKPGCLCHECVHYLNCRLATKPLAIGEVEGEETSKPKWMPTNGSKAVKEVIDVLKAHPEGLTVRQISVLTGISARHVYRVVKALRAQGVVRKLWELRKERIVDTRRRHYETTEIAHRYVLTEPATEGHVIPGDTKEGNDLVNSTDMGAK